MKKFKLFALAAFAMLSTNAFAATDAIDEPAFSKNGVLYQLITTTDGTTVTKHAKVVGVNLSATEAMQKSLTIVSEVTADLGTYKVTEIATDWEAAASYLDVTAVTTSLSIDVTNLDAALAATAYDGFTKLESFTIVDSSTGEAVKTKEFAGGFDNAVKATLATVSLSNNITTLKANAFSGFTKLATINLGNITTFEALSMAQTNLATISLEKAEHIGNGAFTEMSEVTELVIPATVKDISANAFSKQAKLAKVTINGTDESTLLEIPAVFGGDTKLVQIIVNAPKIATIAASAFPANAFTKIDLANTAITSLDNLDLTGAAKSLEEIKLPAALTSIADNKFKDFEKLTAITIPEKVTTIGKYAFAGAKALEEVTIAGAAEIKGFAFADCEKLATVTITGAVTNIGGCVFIRCKALESIDLSKTAIPALNIKTFFNCEKLATITLPETVELIGEQALAGTVLTELVASGVTTFARDALGELDSDDNREANTKLKKVVLGAAYIEDYTFAKCTALEEASLKQDVSLGSYEQVEDYAFYGCTSLKTFNFDAAAGIDKGYVGNLAFVSCSNNPLILFVTSATHSGAYDFAPMNTTFSAGSAMSVKTVLDKGGSGKYYAKLCPATNAVIDPAECKAYSFYYDNGTAYFIALVQENGKYEIKANDHVILKTDAEKEIKYDYSYGGASVLRDCVFHVTEDITLTDFQSDQSSAVNNYDGGNNVNFSHGNYVYRLTNNSKGFGFSYFTGTTMKSGQFFIETKIAPSASGRLNVVWLDENGNVELDETTAIQKVEATAKNAGELYNLAGQKVNASYKGVVIKNGKKYIK